MPRNSTLIRPLASIEPEQARSARARTWAYMFDCFNRRNGKEDGPILTVPDDIEESSKYVATRKYNA